METPRWIGTNVTREKRPATDFRCRGTTALVAALAIIGLGGDGRSEPNGDAPDPTDPPPGDAAGTNGMADSGPPCHARLISRPRPTADSARGSSGAPSLSSSGRRAAFESDAANLVINDANGVSDVFTIDLDSGAVSLVSLTPGGDPGDGPSRLGRHALSDDGTVVVFESDATDLVPDDTNGVTDVFIRDLTTGRTRRLSVSSDGAQADAPCTHPTISGDGRFVAFDSTATVLSGARRPGLSAVFIHDRALGLTTRIDPPTRGNMSPKIRLGASRPALSRDGRFVAYETDENDLVPDDANGATDVVVYDRLLDRAFLASATADGAPGNKDSGHAALSHDGRFVAFASDAYNLVPSDLGFCRDVFRKDLHSGRIVRASRPESDEEANGDSDWPDLAQDGRLVAFVSRASNLVPADSNACDDVFVRDPEGGRTVRLSQPAPVAAAPGWSGSPALAPAAPCAAFVSAFPTLAPRDTNNAADVFVRELWCEPPCPADFNHDGHIDDADLFAFLGAFPDGLADVNLDGITDDFDWTDFFASFVLGC
ncbi:MAG: PD40 domain-containing protein [Phycisphaerae bacterium]|nr:PD40 domain-containing protein [Phycisphaerae bacterium]